MPATKLFDHFDSDFSYALLVQLGEKAALRARRIWARTALPEPREGEFIYGAHSVTVPLNRSGIAFVFRSRSRNVLERGLYEGSLAMHDRILQPLYRRELDGQSCFEIRPGIRRVGASDAELKSIAQDLKQSGLSFHIRDAGYVGLLPIPGRALVVANMAAVRVASKNFQHDVPVTQAKIYGTLSAHVSDAFARASTNDIQQVLEACRIIRSLPEGDPNKILHASWSGNANLGPDTKMIVSTAAAYGERLSLDAR